MGFGLQLESVKVVLAPAFFLPPSQTLHVIARTRVSAERRSGFAVVLPGHCCVGGSGIADIPGSCCSEASLLCPQGKEAALQRFRLRTVSPQSEGKSIIHII